MSVSCSIAGDYCPLTLDVCGKFVVKLTAQIGQLQRLVKNL